MSLRFGLQCLMFFVLASLVVYLVSHPVVNPRLQSAFEKVVSKLDEDPKLYLTNSTRPSLQTSRDLPEPLQKFLNTSLPPFLQDYKNPCWYTDSRLNCLPYFHLIGATKCGTTTLCAQINKHPQLAPVRKENHWIARIQFKEANPNFEALGTLSRYINIFRIGTQEVQRSMVSGFHPKVFGDCSTPTIWENYYNRLAPKATGLIDQEPIFTNAEYIYHLTPAAKILVSVRNPVDRFFSGYMFFPRSNYSLEGFDTYARDQVSDIRKCLQKSSLRACVYNSLGGRLRIGMYHIHLKDFFAVFPRNQVMVVKLEDFSKNMANTMREVYSFLDLEPMSDSKLEDSVGKMMQMPENQRKPERRKIGNMWNSTRQLLYDFYKPYNEELVKLLGPKFDFN